MAPVGFAKQAKSQESSPQTNNTNQKLASVIATVTALYQAAVTSADCDFGSNYTSHFNSSDYCLFDFGYGIIRNFRESNTTSSGDTNVTTLTYRRDIAIWKMGDKDSTVQCYSDISGERAVTSYPNGSTFSVWSGDFAFDLNTVNETVADGVPFSIPGLYFVKGGRVEGWKHIYETGGHYSTVTKAEGDITDLCEVLGGGGGGGAAPAPTPTPPTTEAPSSGQMAAVTIIPGVAAAILNYFFS
jgi:hypothetical protein